MPPMTGKHPTIGDDHEAERTRMEAASELVRATSRPDETWRMPDEHQALIRQQAEELERRLALIKEQAETIADLHRELAARLVLIERQATALRDARTIFVLLMMSRSYQLMRLLGRWGWLAHRIRRVLRSV